MDSIKTRLNAIPSILKRFRQSVLAAAVSGRLTEEWRGKNSLKNNEISSLYRIGKLVGEKTPSKSNSAFWENGTIPWVSPKDMKTSKIKTSKDLISDEALIQEGMKLVPQNSVLMVTRSGILSHTFPVALVARPVTINQDIKSFIPNKSLVSDKFIAIVLKGLEYKILNECTKTGTTVSSVETNLLANLEFILPTKEEQTEIVRRIEQIEQRLKDAQSRINHLTQSILVKAFRGELTAEWREQNPDLISGKIQPRHCSAKSNLNERILHRQNEPEEKRPKKLSAKPGFGWWQVGGELASIVRWAMPTL